jgi:XTP/dITP diphosphohydrolase
VESIDRLRQIVAELRERCPWDKAQTFHSLVPLTIEEAYELIEAILRGEDAEIVEELGDVLLHVFFYARMGEEEGRFSIDTVVERLNQKLIARHPHVYGQAQALDAKAVLAQWEKLKAAQSERSVIGGLPERLPPLLKAYRLQEKAAAVGFDWASLQGLTEKLKEELAELQRAIEANQLSEAAAELGDVLFVLVNLGRHLGIDPERALHQTNQKFEKRFQYIEKRLKEAQKTFAECDLEELDAYWQQSKSLYP